MYALVLTLHSYTRWILVLIAAFIMVMPKLRNSPKPLTWACITMIVSIWIDKGMGMVVTGFVPSPLGKVTGYSPTLPEVLITLSIYAFGALAVTVFYKITLSLRGQLKA